MPYPEPGMAVVAESAFEAYGDPNRIPEYDYERNDPQNPPINVPVGTLLFVLSVPGSVIQLAWGDRVLLWASQSDVQRNTVVAEAVWDTDWAEFLRYHMLHGADPDTIWATRTAWERLDEGFEEL